MICSLPQLQEYLPRIQGGDSLVAVDTEADSLHAYPEKLCLLQLSFDGTDLLIDPLAGYDLTGLFAALQGKELIFHGADYDLRLLHRTYGFVPDRVFDTMMAARLLGYNDFGLRDLVGKELGITLEKGPQKMNWGVRPLPERMARYAINDTRYLRPLADHLKSELRQKQRSEWQAEVCAQLIQEAIRPRVSDPEALWRVKGCDRLEPAAMAVLRELWNWREQEAIAANKPPYFVLSHERLVAISAAVAAGQPVQELVPRHVTSKRASRLAEAISQSLQVPPSEYPRPRRSTGRRLSHQEQAAFDRLKQHRDERAQELAIDPTLIANKSELMRLAQDVDKNRWQLMAWQRRLLSLDGAPGPKPGVS